MTGGDITLEANGARSVVRFGPVAGMTLDAERTVAVADELTARYLPACLAGERLALVPRGEAAKSLANLQALYARFLELGVERDWTVLAVGGGSVTDLAGLAAATWLRGIDFRAVPTTLLAMVDASVGGKNGVDFGGYKNIIGTFAQPSLVQIDESTLASLPELDLAGGLVESIKHALIDGGDHPALVESVVGPDGAVDRGALGPVIRRSVALKASIAAADERESGRRRALNLGHTIGHAVEAVTGLPHGEAVAAGLAAALGLAVERGGSQADAARTVTLLGRLGLPTSLEAARLASLAPRATLGACPVALANDGDFREAVIEALGADKKRRGGEIVFALPLAAGDVRLVPLPIDYLADYVRRAP